MMIQIMNFQSYLSPIQTTEEITIEPDCYTFQSYLSPIQTEILARLQFICKEAFNPALVQFKLNHSVPDVK